MFFKKPQNNQDCKLKFTTASNCQGNAEVHSFTYLKDTMESLFWNLDGKNWFEI